MITDHTDAPPELMPCDCCDLPVSYRRASMWHGQSRICRPCFWTWYDPDRNIDVTDPAQVKAERLRKYGTRDYP